MENQPFFTRDGARLIPNPCARGPWTPNSLHGRAIVGILGSEIERRHGDAAYMPARLTVDLYKSPGLAPFEVVTRVVRDGLRIRVIDAELISEGRSAGRATCQLLRRSANPPGRVWSNPEWDAPHPDEVPDPGVIAAAMWGTWALRPMEGRVGEYGRKRAWLREVRELVGGEPLTPFARVAAGVDYASPMVNGGDAGMRFINSDVTLYLHRLPVGDWVGYESVFQGATDGVAVGHCDLYDEKGRIGAAGVCALAMADGPQAVPAPGAQA